MSLPEQPKLDRSKRLLDAIRAIRAANANDQNAPLPGKAPQANYELAVLWLFNAILIIVGLGVLYLLWVKLGVGAQ